MIYAIQCGRNGPIKFGIAGNPRRRLSTLQTSHHQELVLLGAQKTKNDIATERRIHEHCRADRIRGEWFKPTNTVGAIALRIQSEVVEEYLEAKERKPLFLPYPRYQPREFAVIRHFLKKHAGTPELLPYA